MLEIKDWATLIVALLSILGTAWTILRSPAKIAEGKADKVSDRVDDLSGKMIKLDERISTVEGELIHLPGKDSVHRLEMSLSELRGEMRAMAERMAIVSQTSQRLQEWLLERGK